MALVEIGHSVRIAAFIKLWIPPRLLSPLGASCPKDHCFGDVPNVYWAYLQLCSSHVLTLQVDPGVIAE